MDILWSRGVRKHRIGRQHAKAAMRNSPTIRLVTTARGERAALYVGIDDRGVELEIIAVRVDDGMLVIHVMPTHYRRNHE